ncbi:MAG: uracil-DNA glycosylase family protein [Patescibacteria group bacterium]|nr:uracil-DNA glycosylase family protein [Patescibacteria group bacterium]MCL5261781.1 uracil-DNA glycosylase family protein [Patescibacteria group bacterium]
MNPTARNLSSTPDWSGLRAPWIGVEKIWRMLSDLKLIDYAMVPSEWNERSAKKLYDHVAERKLYITNLATCTQPDARHLPDAVFREYLPLVYEEIKILRPNKIITFGNQVSSIFLKKTVSVSLYSGVKSELLSIHGSPYRVYPTYYPVGQGQRNIQKAARRIRAIKK